MNRSLISLCRTVLAVCVMGGSVWLAAAEADTTTSLWNVRGLIGSAPAVRYGATVGLTQEVWYEGEPLDGKPTRIFAYLGRPSTASASAIKSAPAMLLVHGGGGQAFKDWAEHWAKRGYVALAMDTAGQGPDGKRHAEAGPDQSDNTKFKNFSAAEAREMWSYHAVGAVLRGHGLLKSLPEVDGERIGITGISWGGYLTCLVAGIDHELKVAVPVYGCGFLGDNSIWRDQSLAAMNPDSRALWLSLFDPSTVVGNARCPILFLNGMHDFAYPPDSYRKTYQLVPEAQRTLSVRVDLPHGHLWNFAEVDTFVDHVLKREGKPEPLARLSDVSIDETSATAQLLSGGPAVKAEAHYTTATDQWTTAPWTTVAASIRGTEISAPLPAERPAALFFTVTDKRGLITSTPYVDLPRPNDYSVYVTENGNAVSSATVFIYWTDGTRQRQNAVRTDADGRAVFTGLPVGKLDRIEVRSNSHQRWESSEPVALPTQDYRVNLMRRPSIVVEVSNPNPAMETKAIVVSLLYAKERNGKPGTAAGGGAGDFKFMRVQSRDAENEIAIFDNIESGWYQAVATHADAWAESAPVNVRADTGIIRIGVSLEQSGTIRGRVIDKKTRAAIAGATVQLSAANPDAPKTKQFNVETDRSGNFTVEEIPRATMKLRAEHADYSPHAETLPPADARRPLVIEMSIELPLLSGTIKCGGGPLPGALVVLYKAGEAEVPVATAMSNAQGQYDFGAQKPGRYVAAVDAPVGSDDGAAGKSYNVELEDKPVRLDMEFSHPVRVTGRVLWGKRWASRPEGAMMLMFTRAEGGSASAMVCLDANSQFEAILEPGNYAVGLEDAAGTEVVIPDHDDAEVLIEL